jgi:hypothetical protein
VRKRRAHPDDDEFVIPDESLESEAQNICALFVEARRRRIPGAQGVNWNTNRKHFIAAAKLRRELGIPAEQFVAQQVDALMYHGNVWPAGLTTMKAAESAGQLEMPVPQQTVQRYIAQLGLLQDRRKLYSTLTALRDTVNDFTPLFRYCIAMTLGSTEAFALAEQYRAAASIELKECPYLKDVFGPLTKGLL